MLTSWLLIMQNTPIVREQLSKVPDYTAFRNFELVIEKTLNACAKKKGFVKLQSNSFAH
jgi:hypothetical protein